MNLTTIESGTFVMGTNVGPESLSRKMDASPEEPHWDEGPAHEVTLSYPFQLSIAPITNEEFARFRPAHHQTVEERRLNWTADAPVELVTWHDAVDYCAWLSELEGKPFRLPTEAEWECAAHRSRELGLQDMEGERREWCHDWWEAPYPAEPQTDPVGSAAGSVRVIRGGRPTDRGGSVPEDRRPRLGFRVVQAPLPATTPLPVPPPGAPFQNVSQVKKVWTPPQGAPEPFYSGGMPYIELTEDPARLPYFGRHHVPALIWCDNGDLLAAAFTAPFDKSTEMAILFTRLRDGHTKWDPAVRCFIAPDRNVTAAAFYHGPEGEIHHYNGLGGFEDAVLTTFSTIKRTSRDHGATWSDWRLVHEYPARPGTPDDFQGEPRLWPHMDILTLADGTMIMPSDSGPGQTDGSVGTVLFESRDQGETWKERTRYGWNLEEYAKPSGRAGWIAGIHAPMVVLNDGRWLAFGRGRNIEGKSPWSESSDEGRSWTYRQSPFPPLLSGQRPVLLRLQEGPILLISHTGMPEKGADPVPVDLTDSKGNHRRMLGTFAALSYDEGRTWPKVKLLPVDPAQPDESDLRGYLSCVQTPDRTVHLLSSRRYYRFNLAWLETPHP